MLTAWGYDIHKVLFQLHRLVAPGLAATEAAQVNNGAMLETLTDFARRLLRTSNLQNANDLTVCKSAVTDQTCRSV